MLSLVQAAAIAAFIEKLLDVELADHHEVVVADQAQVAGLARERHALVRLGAIAHEVAEAPRGVHAHTVDVLEHGLQGGQVGVNVREDGHARRLRRIAAV